MNPEFPHRPFTSPQPQVQPGGVPPLRREGELVARPPRPVLDAEPPRPPDEKVLQPRPDTASAETGEAAPTVDEATARRRAMIAGAVARLPIVSMAGADAVPEAAGEPAPDEPVTPSMVPSAEEALTGSLLPTARTETVLAAGEPRQEEVQTDVPLTEESPSAQADPTPESAPESEPELEPKRRWAAGEVRPAIRKLAAMLTEHGIDPQTALRPHTSNAPSTLTSLLPKLLDPAKTNADIGAETGLDVNHLAMQTSRTLKSLIRLAERSLPPEAAAAIPKPTGALVEQRPAEDPEAAVTAGKMLHTQATKRGWSVRGLAEALGYSPSNVSRLFNGQSYSDELFTRVMDKLELSPTVEQKIGRRYLKEQAERDARVDQAKSEASKRRWARERGEEPEPEDNPEE